MAASHEEFILLHGRGSLHSVCNLGSIERENKYEEVGARDLERIVLVNRFVLCTMPLTNKYVGRDY